ncbi:MAG: hypothetical protein OXE81_07745, partial [Gammaproteobacteria bacterium]|nr:hypothetical protein [Gammaproteobacteria bacterium]
CVAALGNMPDIPCGLRLALGDCAHSESHLFMGQDTREALVFEPVSHIEASLSDGARSIG